MVLVQRRAETREEDDEEEQEEGQGDVVPAQAPPRQKPGALALDRAALVRRRERCSGVEGEMVCGLCPRVLGPSLPPQTESVRRALAVSALLRRSSYFMQLKPQSQ